MVRAQRLRLNADLIWLGSATGCYATHPVRMAVRGAAPPALLAMPEAAAVALSSITNALPVAAASSWAEADAAAAASAAAAAAPPALQRPVALRNTVTIGGGGGGPPDKCCDYSFKWLPVCCTMFCQWAVDYLGMLTTLDDCCVEGQIWAMEHVC